MGEDPGQAGRTPAEDVGGERDDVHHGRPPFLPAQHLTSAGQPELEDIEEIQDIKEI